MTEFRQWQFSLVTLAVIPLLLSGVAPSELEESWPQWGGPHRNFHASSSGLSTSWPDGGPRRVWHRPLGEGYSAVVYGDQALFTMYREDDREVVISMHAVTGHTRWEHRYPAPLNEHMDYGTWLRQGGAGPYSTPMLVDRTLYAVGTTGMFHALDADTGAVRWSHNLDEEFAMTGYRGYAPSPIEYEGNILLPIGGPGQGVVAFDKATGEVVWKNQDFLLAPASPILIDVDGQDQLVVFSRTAVYGLTPRGGDLIWSAPHPTNYGLNISTPVWGPNNLLYVSAAYDGGARVVRLSRSAESTRAETVWTSNRMRLHFGNAIRIGDVIFGTSGDFGPAFLSAVDIRTGEELWRERTFSRSQMVYADGKLVLVEEGGDLAIVSVDSEGLTVHSRAELLTDNAWTPPTLVGTTLFVRDRKNLVAVDLGE